MSELTDQRYLLREPALPYTAIFGGKNGPLRLKNTVFWEGNLEISET